MGGTGIIHARELSSISHFVDVNLLCTGNYIQALGEIRVKKLIGKKLKLY
jgi:hypothetical protein